MMEKRNPIDIQVECKAPEKEKHDYCECDEASLLNCTGPRPDLDCSKARFKPRRLNRGERKRIWQPVKVVEGVETWKEQPDAKEQIKGGG